MAGAPSSILVPSSDARSPLLLVAMPGALPPSSDASSVLVPSSDEPLLASLFLVAMPGAPCS